LRTRLYRQRPIARAGRFANTRGLGPLAGEAAPEAAIEGDIVTEGEQLLRAVLEEPGDDTVRLVYADWLEENGRGREAAYIRNGVAICHPERLNPEHDMGAGWDGIIDIITQYPPADPEHCPLCRAIQDQRDSGFTRRIARDVGLSFGKPADWSGRKDPGCPVYVGVRCRGGFASEVTCVAADFTEPAARSLFSRHPVTAVHLVDRIPGFPEARPHHLGWRGWVWYPPDDGPGWHPASILQELWNELEGGKLRPGGAWKLYPTDAEAHAALSTRLVNWGRSLVKPPLKSLESEKDKPVSERISS
jgi:uncharacterized protein (TIGR02996 family)